MDVLGKSGSRQTKMDEVKILFPQNSNSLDCKKFTRFQVRYIVFLFHLLITTYTTLNVCKVLIRDLSTFALLQRPDINSFEDFFGFIQGKLEKLIPIAFLQHWATVKVHQTEESNSDDIESTTNSTNPSRKRRNRVDSDDASSLASSVRSKPNRDVPSFIIR